MGNVILYGTGVACSAANVKCSKNENSKTIWTLNTICWIICALIELLEMVLL